LEEGGGTTAGKEDDQSGAARRGAAQEQDPGAGQRSEGGARAGRQGRSGSARRRSRARRGMEGGGDRTADKILELLPSQTVQTPEGKNGTFSLFSPLFLFVLTTIWSSQKEKGRLQCYLEHVILICIFI
jgi:hypothetical protein